MAFRISPPKIIFGLLFLVSVSAAVYFYHQNFLLTNQNHQSLQTISQISTDLKNFQSQDLYKTNATLKDQLDQIQKTFKSSVSVYESWLDLQNPPKDVKNIGATYAVVLADLGQGNYASASAILTDLSKKIADEQAKTASATTIPANVATSNNAPATGYSHQQVSTPNGNFLVDIVAGDLSNTKVIVDTASDATCGNNCPLLPLATYVSRSGAYAGINGSYFCPASYPSCVGKTNSFDLLLMNKNKIYFNSDNNVYSNNPGVVFGGNYIRFLTAVSQWGRDTSINGMISNFPLLVFNSNITYSSPGDSKMSIRTTRAFVANKGNVAYIGMIHGATVAEAAIVLKTLGMENALNLDDAGSAALWDGGYKVGPGRDIPNAILFVKK